MMRKLNAFSALIYAALAAALFSSCDLGIAMKDVGGLLSLARSKTETRTVAAFTSIEIVGGTADRRGQLDLRQGVQEVVITANTDDIANITTVVTGTRLVIDASELLGQGVTPHFQITMPLLEELVVTSCYCNMYTFSGLALSCTVNSGCVDTHGWPVTYDEVTLNSLGGYISMAMLASMLSCTNMGQEGIDLSGSADTATFVQSGSGGMNLHRIFTAKNATVSSSGSGSILLTATDTLDVTLSGAGNVYYLGDPVITQNVTGTGSLIQKADPTPFSF
jgi:hypothetical protein